MLVLSRRVGQRVMIGDEVVVSVVEVRGNTVRLGIQAPTSVPIHREELLLREPVREPLEVELAC